MGDLLGVEPAVHFPHQNDGCDRCFVEKDRARSWEFNWEHPERNVVELYYMYTLCLLIYIYINIYILICIRRYTHITLQNISVGGSFKVLVDIWDSSKITPGKGNLKSEDGLPWSE